LVPTLASFTIDHRLRHKACSFLARERAALFFLADLTRVVLSEWHLHSRVPRSRFGLVCGREPYLTVSAPDRYTDEGKASRTEAPKNQVGGS
jgi:hypothetical protein